MTAVLDRPILDPVAFERDDERRFPPDHPYRDDPVGFSRDILRFDPWSKQAEILESVRDHRRTAVRSAHGVGKTAVAARVALWFLATHPGDTRVITTGLSWEGVKNLLWKEIHEAHRMAGGAIGGKLSDTYLDLGEKWFATGLSTDKPERFQGHHADNLLLIVDEASGLKEEIFEAASGYLTNSSARLLLIGNPTQHAGEFHAAFHSKSDEYHTIAISAFDTPAFTGETIPDDVNASIGDLPAWVDEMAALYGEDSAVYQVRVLGKFATSSEDTVCSLAEVEAAQERVVPRHEPVVIGCDVARFGSDETVIAVRRGKHVRIVRRYSGRDTMKTVAEIMTVAHAVTQGHTVGERVPGVEEIEGRTPRTYPPTFLRIVVDDDGVGGGVTDRLHEINKYTVVPFHAGAASISGDYPNRRSEVWFSFADRLEQLDLDPDPKLGADLVAPKYKLDAQSRRVVESKDETKKRLKRSPDSADAVLLTFSVPDEHLRPAGSRTPESQPITAGLMGRKW